MDKSKIDKLIVNLIDNTISEKDKQILLTWLENEEHVVYFNEFVEVNALLNSREKFDYNHSLKKTLKLIKYKQKRKRFTILKYAAAVVILISSASFFLVKSDLIKNNDPIIVNNNIKAGTDKAILTLQTGEEIVLEKDQQYVSNNVNSTYNKIVYKPDANVYKKAIEYNYLTIPRGGAFFLKLADGTQVWLNSETQLKYPVSFKDGELRKVELVYGEAYFNVSPSTKHGGSKFMVSNKSQDIEVLGTQFNIKAYNDESHVYTTLVEGKVAINYENKKQILKPSEQASLDINTKKINIKTIEVYKEVAWREGVFSFKSKSLKDIMKVLSRWYDFEVVFENKKLEENLFIGNLKKSQKIKDILSILQISDIIKAYEIHDKTILLK